MAFDECTPNKGKTYAVTAMKRTHQWLLKSIEEWQKNNYLSLTTGKYQALFGIIQGGDFKDLRLESAHFVCSQKELDGIAIGGETVGQNIDKTEQIFSWIKPFLADKKPIYLMGYGRDPEDLVKAIKMGVDIFDCVAPTRMARNGALYSGKIKNDEFYSEFPKGRLNIGNRRFKKDFRPISQDCDCPTCQAGYTRAYLNHLYKNNELVYFSLASSHNLRFMLRLCETMRQKMLK